MIKFWKKLSISHKLFLCTVVMFSAVLLLLFAGQLFFYEKYYYFLLENELKEAISEFSDEYFNLKTDDEINKSISEFSVSNDAFIFILNDSGNIIHMSSYDMYIEDSGQTYHVLLDNAIHDKNFLDLNLKENSTITITYSKEGYAPAENNIIIPIKIKYNDKEWSYRKHPPSGREITHELVSITGTITSVSLPLNSDSKISIQKNEAFDAIMSWRRNGNFISENEGFKKYHYAGTESDAEYCVVSYNLSEHHEYILAVKPLHSVSEAVYAMKDIVKLWCLCILIIAFIVSIIFSKMVTRQIIKITDITKRIKKLDFSQKCKVSSHDEVGILAENINDMSEQLNNTINELIEANKQLTDDIEHERILEKQRKEFIAVISHELKTPLGIIRAYSEGLIDGVAQQEKYLNVIINETRKMDALILDMLEDSKLEIGAQQIDLKKSDFSEYCKNIVKKFRESCKSKNIFLIENISSTPIIKKFDKDLLERVISNFLLNAIRYAENKTITVTLNGDIFSVENEGEHISEDELGKIWDKFYCVGKSTSHFTGGTGLGLSIAKNILNLHNAEFGVRNTESGVMFWFRLPE